MTMKDMTAISAARLSVARQTRQAFLTSRYRCEVNQLESDPNYFAVKVLERQVAEKDALIAEWMHSTEAFRRLARQLGKKLGVTDEQRSEYYANHAVDIAEEDPKFANTTVANEARKKKESR